MRAAIALASAGAVGYAAGRRALRGGGLASLVPTGSLRERVREVPRKLHALADLGIEQARQTMESLPGSVRIVAAAPPDPED